MSATDASFTVIGEGGALLAALDENSESFFADLARLREIIAALGEGATAAPALAFSLGDKAGSAKALAAYFDSGFGMPEIEQAYEAQTVAELARLVGDEELRTKAKNWNERTRSLHYANSDDTKKDVYEHLKARGISGGLPARINRATLRDNVRDGDKILAESIAQNPEYVAVKAQIQKELDERGERLAELLRIAGGKTGASEAEMNAAADEYRALQKDGLVDRVNKLNTDMWNKVAADRAARHAALFRESGEVIVSTLLEASSVSNEDALAWAKAQRIDADAVAKLKRQGYKLDQFYQDMADFYRLTGGKASAIRFLAGGKRASAGGIETVTGEKYINLDTNFNKVTLWHELAHHLENDPLAKAAANGFLLKRRESDTRYTLRSLTGSKFYGPKEIAWRDSFTDPYVGRIYQDGATEVFSMGLQYLSDPAKAAWFVGKDPEMFDLVTGYVGNPISPAMRAKLDMHKGAIDDKQDEAAKKEAEYKAALAWLADRAPITKENWFNEADRSTYWWNMFEAYVLGKEKTRAPAYVGSSGPFKVFSGAYKKLGSARYVKGWQIVYGEPVEGETIPDNIAVHGDMELVRAVIAIATINGTGASSAFYRYVFNSTGKDMIVHLVSGMK